MALSVLTSALASSGPELKMHFLSNGGLDKVMSILNTGGPAATVHQCVRIVHLMCSTFPQVTPVLVTSHALVTHLVTLLGWCLCGNKRNKTAERGWNEGREGVFRECVRALYAVGNSHPGYMERDGDLERFESLTHLGCLVVKGLNGGYTAERRVKEIIKLLMVMPGTFTPFLRVNGGVGRLVEYMDRATDREVVERVGGGGMEVVAVMNVLRNIVETDETARLEVEEKVFGGPLGGRGEGKDKQKLEPEDAPVYTLRWKVIKCMTSVDGHVKRASSEFVWALCGGEPEAFTRRTGFGNAVHFLGLKGVVETPKHDGGGNTGGEGQ